MFVFMGTVVVLVFVDVIKNKVSTCTERQKERKKDKLIPYDILLPYLRTCCSALVATALVVYSFHSYF